MAKQFNPATGQYEEVGTVPITGTGTTDPLTQPQTTTPATTTEAETSDGTVKPVRQDLWDTYTGITSKYGLTPMSVEDFNSQLGDIANYGSQGAEKIKSVHTDFNKKILVPLYDQVKGVVNKLNQDYTTKSKGTYTAIGGDYTGTYGSADGEDPTKVASNINKAFSDAFDTAKYNVDNYEKNKQPEDTYERPAEIQTVLDDLNTQVGVPVGEAPTHADFSPDVVNQWVKQFAEQEAPLEKQAQDKTTEQYNFLNPYGLGSGGHLRASNELTQNITNDRINRATDIAQTENEKAYSDALTKWNYLTAKHEDALNSLTQIAGFETGAKQAAKSNNLSVFMANKNMDFMSNQNALNRQYQQEQQTSEREYAKTIADMYKPRQKDFFDYLSPVLTGTGYALGGPIGAGVATAVKSGYDYMTKP